MEPGDEVIASEDAYYGTPLLLRDHFSRWGLGVNFVDMRDPGAIERAVTPRTRLIWIETPSNPRLHVTDIAACVAIAARCGAKTVVDNTWADAGLAASIHAWRGSRDALDDQVPRRTQRRAGWCRHRARKRRVLCARAGDPGRRRRRAGAVRLLAGAARHPVVAVPHARPCRRRAPARGLPRGAAGDRARLLSRAALGSRPCRRVAADVRLWRDAVDWRARRARRGVRSCGAAQAGHAGDESRRA